MGTSVIMQATFASGVLSPFMDARVDQERYGSGCRVLRNMFVMPHGPASRRPGTVFAGALKYPDRVVRLVDFVFNAVQAYVLEFGHGYMRVWANTAQGGGLVLNPDNTPYEIEMPFDEASLRSLYWCQSGDVLYLVFHGIFPRKLVRHGHADWRLSVIDFSANIAAPGNLAATVTGSGSRKYYYVVTAVSDENGEESIASSVVMATAADTLNATNYVKLTWDRHPDAKEYRVYLSRTGPNSFGFLGTAGQAAEGATPEYTDRGGDPDYEQGLPVVATPFDGATPEDFSNCPSVVTFWGQRLCFAASTAKPQTVWMSQTGNFENLNTHSPLQADDAYELTIAADRVNSIMWLVPGKKLCIGTVGGEWTLTGKDGGNISPTSDPDIQRHTVRGSAPLRPVVVGNTVLYVQRGGRVVREFRYSLESDGYDSSDLSILSEHLFATSGIVAWAYQQDPYSLVWIVRSDGTLAAVTYSREHNVVGWHEHDTPGFVEDVCCVPGADGDEVWLTVRRIVGGQTVRYMERLAPFWRGEEGKAPVDAYFVDCGLTYRGAAVTEIQGLDHLEGLTVAVLADGAVHPDRVVTDGRITLQRAASVVTVGLGYVSDLSPMKLEIPQRDGTSSSRVKRISRVVVRLWNSVGLKAGPDAERLTEAVFRTGDMAGGEPIPLFTGEKKVELRGGHETGPTLLLRQDYPLPMTVLAVVTTVDVGER